MEKKKVRLYKAQEGGQPPIDMMGYPGSQQEQQQLSEDQVLQMVMNDISQEMPKAAIVNKLVNGVGLDITQANQYVESVYAAIEQQKEQYGENEETEDEEEREVNEMEGKLVEEDEEEEQEMEDIKGHSDLAMEDEEGEEEYLTELEDEGEDMMRYGGTPRMQYGGESEEVVTQEWDDSDYPVYFPGVEAYLPSAPYDYSNDAADIAWQAPEFEGMEQEEIDYSEPAVNPEEFRYGGYKTKKGYVNNVLRLVKKQLGGDQEEEVSDDSDPRGEDYRTNHLDAFLGSVKREGNITLAKEQAEKEYEQAMQQYQMMMSPQQEALSQYIPQGYEIPEAQFGMQVPQGFRNQRQYARFMRNLPMGAGASMAPVSKIDVTRSGLFGRPRRYSVEFDTSPLKAMAANPMMPGIYGYGMGTKTTRTPARVITETISSTVNNKATEEVANATNSDAAATSATNGNTTNTSTQANPETGKPNKTALGTGPTVPGQEKPVVVPPRKKEEIKPTETIKPKVGAPKDVVRYQHMDTGKSYFYDPKNKKWYRGESKTPITDKTAIENLNRWEKKGIVMPIHTASNYERKQMMDNINARPQSIIADDELISTLALFGTGSLGSGAARAVGAEQALLGAGERAALNAGQRMFNPGQRMLNTGQSMLNAGQRMLNPGQKMLNPPGGFQYRLPFQEGGFVDSANPDLYRFVYGGYDPSIPQIGQDDIDYMYSKDTSDAYFQAGGEKKNPGEPVKTYPKEQIISGCFNTPNGQVCLPSEKATGSNAQTPEVQTNATPVITNQTVVPPVMGYPGSQMINPAIMFPQYPSVGGYLQNIIPANLGRQYYSKYLGTRGAQGMPMMPQFGPNTMIKKIDVTKSGLFGQPKRYSVTFSNPEMDPTKQNVITLDNSAPQTLSAKELRRDEKQAGRQRPLRAGRRYEQYFEDRPSTQEDFDRKAKYDAIAQEQLNAAQSIPALLSGRSPQAGMSQEQIQQVQSIITNPSGLPEYADTPRRKYDNPSSTAASAPVNEGYWKDGNWYESQDAYGKIMNKRSEVDKFVDDWAKKWNIPKEEASMAFAKEVGVFPAFTNLKDIEKYDQIYNAYVQKQKGNKKQYGGNTPVVYTNNPALAGLSDVDIISLNPGIPGLGTPSWAEPMPGAPQMPTIQDTGVTQPKQYTEDPMQANRNVIQKTYAPPAGDFTMDFKTKSKVKDPQANILAANAAIEGVTGMINRFRNKDREAELYKNLTADNLYAQKTPTDRGDYDTNTGLYRPNEQGQVWNSRSAQFGGSMEPYTEGDEVYMTEEELQEFLKNGGEVEYL